MRAKLFFRSELIGTIKVKALQTACKHTLTGPATAGAAHFGTYLAPDAGLELHHDFP